MANTADSKAKRMNKSSFVKVDTVLPIATRPQSVPKASIIQTPKLRHLRKTLMNKNIDGNGDETVLLPMEENHDLVHKLFNNVKGTDFSSRGALSSIIHTTEANSSEPNQEINEAMRCFYMMKNDLRYLQLYKFKDSRASAKEPNETPVETYDIQDDLDFSTDGKYHLKQVLEAVRLRDDFLFGECNKLIQTCPVVARSEFQLSSLCSNNLWSFLAVSKAFAHLFDVMLNMIS